MTEYDPETHVLGLVLELCVRRQSIPLFFEGMIRAQRLCPVIPGLLYLQVVNPAKGCLDQDFMGELRNSNSWANRR